MRRCGRRDPGPLQLCSRAQCTAHPIVEYADLDRPGKSPPACGLACAALAPRRSRASPLLRV